MPIVAWVLLGLMLGYVTSRLANHEGRDLFLDLAVGSAGAVAGGVASSLVGGQGTRVLDLWSALLAVGGGVVVLSIYAKVAERWSWRWNSR